jgi:type VI secretion system protein ImpK
MGDISPGIRQQQHAIADFTQDNFASHPSSYYRSRVFNAHTGINHLVAAAQAIIALIGACSLATTPVDPKQLIANLDHELLTFANQAYHAGYTEETIKLAKFMLIGSLCQTLSKPTHDGQQADQVLWRHYFNDTPKQPLTMIHQLMADGTTHLELLELCYICLNLGFPANRGINENTPRCLTEPDSIQLREELYQLIRYHRGDSAYRLSVTPTTSEQPRTKWPIPARRTVTLCALIFIFIYCGFSYIIRVNHTLLPAPLKIQATTADITATSDASDMTDTFNITAATPPATKPAAV